MKRYNEGYRSNKPDITDEEREINRKRMYKNSLAWYHTNKEKVAEKRRKKYQEQPVARLHYGAKVRAKKKGIPFTITVEDIPPLPDLCPITLEKFRYESPEKGVASYYAPSLDRIDNSKGYIPGNVRIISYRANHWKNNMSLNDIERLLKYMRGEI